MTEKEIKDLANVLYEKFNAMSVLELHEMTQSFQKVLGSPVGVIATDTSLTTSEEKTEFEVMLQHAGEKKIMVIKEVRGALGLGLREAKELVEKAPIVIAESLNKEDAEKLKDTLEGAGATVTLN